MDQNLNAKRVHNTELGFNTTRMVFIFGNLATLAMITFGDLSSDPFKLALSAFVIIINIASVLSFDTELSSLRLLAKTQMRRNQTMHKLGQRIHGEPLESFAY